MSSLTTFLDLPDEIFFLIGCYLDFKVHVNMRLTFNTELVMKTTKSFAHAAQEQTHCSFIFSKPDFERLQNLTKLGSFVPYFKSLRITSDNIAIASACSWEHTYFSADQGGSIGIEEAIILLTNVLSSLQNCSLLSLGHQRPFRVGRNCFSDACEPQSRARYGDLMEVAVAALIQANHTPDELHLCVPFEQFYVKHSALDDLRATF